MTDVLGGKTNLLTGWFSGGSYFNKQPSIQLFQAGQIPSGYLQLTGSNVQPSYGSDYPVSRLLDSPSAVTLPGGQTINSTGDSFRDAIISKFGLPPDIGQGDTFTDAKTGETVAQPGASIFSDIAAFIEGLIGRAAIIILGFIFVAVGLSLFRNPNATIERAARSATNAAKGAL
jgi:hypothetical protein